MPSVWHTNFKNHALWTHLSNLQEALKGLAAPTDEAQAEDFARLVRMAETLAEHREQNPALYAPAMLDNLAGTMANVTTYMSQYAADPSSPQGLLNAAAQLDALAQYLAQMPGLPPAGKVAAAARAATRYEQATNRGLAEVTKRLDAVRSALTEAQREIEAIKASVAEEVSKSIEEIGAKGLGAHGT